MRSQHFGHLLQKPKLQQMASLSNNHSLDLYLPKSLSPSTEVPTYSWMTGWVDCPLTCRKLSLPSLMLWSMASLLRSATRPSRLPVLTRRDEGRKEGGVASPQLLYKPLDRGPELPLVIFPFGSSFKRCYQSA